MRDFNALSQTFEQITLTQVQSTPQYLQNYAVDGVEPQFVLTPQTIETASQIVALAQQNNLSVLPYGGGTQINFGGVPEQIGVLLRTIELNRLLEHEAPDLTCQVEAGMRLADLQNKLAQKGQRLALDPPEANQTTIGGLLATNASGPKRWRYGTARDLVIGMRVIQADGEISRSGGKVVKNVAGYDLNKLYIGSMGTLGIIVEVNFKLHPLPEREQTLWITTRHLDEIMGIVKLLIRSQLTPSAIELINDTRYETTQIGPINLTPGNYALAINFEGSTIAITRQIDDVHRQLGKAYTVSWQDLQGQEQEHLWEALRGRTRSTITCKVALLPSHMTNYIRTIEHICRNYHLEASLTAHAGNGILYIALGPHDKTSSLVQAIAELRLHAQESRGSLVVESCPLDLKQRLNVWGEPRADFMLMQRIKQQFDPHGTFVRGRYLGGL